MKATINKKQDKITFTGIANQSQLDDVVFYASKTGCKYTQHDYATKIIVTGTPEQIKAFVKLY